MAEDPGTVRKSNINGLISGFVIGGIIGAIVAILSAPQSGEKTRSVIVEKSTVIKDQVVDQAGKTRGQAEKVISNARGKMQNAAQMTRERAAEVLHRDTNRQSEQVERMEEMESQPEK